MGPLRPPRLGRYRDAPPEAPRVRPPPPPWTPREEKPAIDSTVAQQLTEFSSDDWRDIYTLAWSMCSGAVDLPARTLKALGQWTADGLARLRRGRTPSPTPPLLPEPPEGWFDDHDLRLLMSHWNAARAPDYQPSGIIVQRNEHGLLIGHLSLDDNTMAVIRPVPRGRPHSLANLVQTLPGRKLRSWLTKEVPLEIKVGDEQHPFRHVRAGPIFGELALGERTFLLAAMSIFIVLVEVRDENAKVVWVGRGEMLPTLTLDAASSDALAEKPGVEVPEGHVDRPAPAAHQAPTEVGARASSRELDDERQRRRAAEDARTEALQKVEAIVGDLDEERQRRAAAEDAHARTAQELAARTREVADEQRSRELLEHELAAAMLALGLAKRVAEVLPAELAAQVEARERSATEAHVAMQMLKKTMEILTRHSTDDVLADWKQQIVTVLLEVGAELGPDALAAARFAEQFIGAFRRADALPENGVEEREAAPTMSESPGPVELMPHPPELSVELHAPAVVPVVDPLAQARTGDAIGVSPATSLAAPPREATPLPDRHMVPSDPEPDTVISTRVAGESSSTSQAPSSALTSDRPANPPSSRRARQGSKWPSLDPVDVVSKSPPSAPKVGRNDPCPCGSGKKFKKCCWLS